jgi:hypothetical protein
MSVTPGSCAGARAAAVKQTGRVGVCWRGSYYFVYCEL